MKKRGTLIGFILAGIFLCISLCACASGEDDGIQNLNNNQEVRSEDGNSGEQSDIVWIRNEDGTYTFTNKGGKENSIYAWYVLDENNQPIYKTKYSESTNFVYDLENNYNLTIKGFIRTGTKEEYEQTSMKVSAADILGPKEYTVTLKPISEETIILLRNQILKSNQATLPVESVLAGDGSEWEVDLTIPVDWSCPNISNRSFGFRTNGLTFLDDTYSMYLDTQDEKYSNVIKDYLVDWAEQNTKYDKENTWVWHDDATALRVMRMSLYYYEFKKSCSEKEQKLIEDSLKYQAELLTTDEFYTEMHNHGMHQDIALLTYALLLADNDRKESYLSTAIKRTGEYLDYVYTEDGIHKEHSPYYARDVLADTIFLKKIMENISPDFSNHIGQYVDGAQEYLIQLIKPDGTWPSLGDSSKTDGVKSVENVLNDNEEYLWIASGGEKGTAPKSEGVFPEGGYAIFRSSWTDKDDEATWMMLVASTFSSTHKHGDDLEVLLYHKGDLFVEAGNRNYNYTDEMTAWAYSGYAHNVLLINGEAYPVKIGESGFQSIYPEALDTGITGYELGGDVVSVTGREHRFTNVEQERTLSYDKRSSTVTVSDVLEADENFEGTLLYHLAEGIKAEQSSDGWNLYRDNELVAVVSIAGDADFEVDMVNGQENEYPYCTWIFNGNDSPEYGSLLKINISGKVGSNKIETIVNLK